MQLERDTIVAISTPPGRGGIGIVRLSGPDAQTIAAPLLRLRTPLAPTRACFGEVLDEEGAVLDEALITYFEAPHSYTAEDVIEIAAHGSPVLLAYLVRAAVSRGARLAEPGEFTQRAFLNGRLDLTQAEAVEDLIASQTLYQAKLAAAQLGGSLARTVAPAKEQLVRLIAMLEAGIDFAEDEVELASANEIRGHLDSVRAPLERLAASYAHGRVVREGFTLAIVGRPNAGKSSLFNRLLDRDRAIVTAQPGTTRDPIVERWSLAGIPVELVDTAGLRAVPDGPECEAERAGIVRTQATMAEADLVMLVLDATAGLGTATSAETATIVGAEEVRALRALEGRPHLLVINKIDLVACPPVLAEGTEGPMRTSAVTGEGLDDLKRAIVDRLTGGSAAGESESALLTNLRQHHAVDASLASLEAAERALGTSLPQEMLLLDLYRCLEALDALTGATTTDDILRLIFSTFCIGK